jgi:hypothetical protein
VRLGPGKTAKNKKRKRKKYSGQQQKEIDCDEPHPMPNEKTQPIQWTERPTGALVAVNSLWPAGGYWFTLGKTHGVSICCERKRERRRDSASKEVVLCN